MNHPPAKSSNNRNVLLLALMLCFSVLSYFVFMNNKKSPLHSPGIINSFSVAYNKSDDSCGNIANYCIKAKCGIKNNGISGGNTNVTIVLTKHGTGLRSIAEHHQTVYVAAGDTVEVSHNFFEASRFNNYSAFCMIQ